MMTGITVALMIVITVAPQKQFWYEVIFVSLTNIPLISLLFINNSYINL